MVGFSRIREGRHCSWRQVMKDGEIPLSLPRVWITTVLCYCLVASVILSEAFPSLLSVITQPDAQTKRSVNKREKMGGYIQILRIT